MRGKLRAGFLAFATLLLLASVALAATEADWNVMAGGGGHAEAGIYSLEGTIGQPTMGWGPSGYSELCSGFWCRQDVALHDSYYTNLPLIMRLYQP